jgi:hypothetical protein
VASPQAKQAKVSIMKAQHLAARLDCQPLCERTARPDGSLLHVISLCEQILSKGPNEPVDFRSVTNIRDELLYLQARISEAAESFSMKALDRTEHDAAPRGLPAPNLRDLPRSISR